MSDAPLRVGMIGAGGISGAHMPAYKEYTDQIKLIAVSDINIEAAVARAAEFGADAVHSGVDAMLRDADIEAVDICTTHESHYRLAMAAIEAGKHVLIEKPFTCTLAEAREVVAAAGKAGLTLMVAQCQRYDPSYRGVKKLIEQGALGDIRAVRFDSMQNLPLFLPDNHWLFDGKEAGGGIVISVAVHRIDLMRYLLGEITGVFAVKRNLSGIMKNDAEDYAAGVLAFENGAIGEMFATYVGYRMPWSEQFMIFGDQGTIHAVPPQGEPMGPGMVAHAGMDLKASAWEDQCRGFVPVESEMDGLQTDSQFINELLHFAQCCKTGAEPISSGRDNLGTMRVIEGFYRSTQTKAWVDLNTL